MSSVGRRRRILKGFGVAVETEGIVGVMLSERGETSDVSKQVKRLPPDPKKKLGSSRCYHITPKLLRPVPDSSRIRNRSLSLSSPPLPIPLPKPVPKQPNQHPINPPKTKRDQPNTRPETAHDLDGDAVRPGTRRVIEEGGCGRWIQ